MLLKKKIDFFKDDRGRIDFLYKNKCYNLNLIFSKKNSIRGNHYHKKFNQFFYLINGSAYLFFKPRKKNRIKKIFISKKILYEITKYTAHTFVFKKNSILLEFSNKKMSKENYMKDSHILKLY